MIIKSIIIKQNLIKVFISDLKGSRNGLKYLFSSILLRRQIVQLITVMLI